MPCMRCANWMHRRITAEPSADVGWLSDHLMYLRFWRARTSTMLDFFMHISVCNVCCHEFHCLHWISFCSHENIQVLTDRPTLLLMTLCALLLTLKTTWPWSVKYIYRKAYATFLWQVDTLSQRDRQMQSRLSSSFPFGLSMKSMRTCCVSHPHLIGPELTIWMLPLDHSWVSIVFSCLSVCVFPPSPLLWPLHPRLHPQTSLIKKQQLLIIKAVGHPDKISPSFSLSDSSMRKEGEQ